MLCKAYFFSLFYGAFLPFSDVEKTLKVYKNKMIKYDEKNVSEMDNAGYCWNLMGFAEE